MTPSSPKSSAGRRYLLVLVLLTLAVLAVGDRLYRVQMWQRRQAAEQELATVAKTKVDQIVAWRAAQLGDASGVIEDPFFVTKVERWLQAPSPEIAAEMLARFKGLRHEFHYHEIALVDTQWRKVLSLTGALDPLVAEEISSLALAVSQDKPVLSDIYRRKDGVRQTAVAAPIRLRTGAAPKLLGALMLVIDADDFLYPLIQTWPTASRSAETELVERQGDHVLFLNELRHLNGAALAFKIPLTRVNNPAVLAVMGQDGLFEGTDYRGVPVVTYSRRVANSPWFMVVKVDKVEAFATLRSESTLMLALLTVLVVLMLALGAMLWQRTQRYRLAYEGERERQRLEQALREHDERHRLEVQMRDELLSHVSHELRTPMAVVHQFATILTDGLAGPTTTDQQHYLTIILANVQQLQTMIDDLLDAVRLETGKLAFEPQSFALAGLIAEVSKSFAPAAAVHQLTLRTAVAPGLPPVWADPRRVRQIFGNLIENGIKFTPAHGRITVQAAPADGEANFVRVSVVDTGIGISPEQQAKVFERLYQVDGSNPGASRKGLGLGLHICTELVALHGGRIWLESAPDHGTAVHFTLPIQPLETNHGKT